MNTTPHDRIEAIIQDAFKRSPDPTYKYSFALGVLQGHACDWLEEITALRTLVESMRSNLNEEIEDLRKQLQDAQREIAHSRDREVV